MAILGRGKMIDLTKASRRLAMTTILGKGRAANVRTSVGARVCKRASSGAQEEGKGEMSACGEEREVATELRSHKAKRDGANGQHWEARSWCCAGMRERRWARPEDSACIIRERERESCAAKKNEHRKEGSPERHARRRRHADPFLPCLCAAVSVGAQSHTQATHARGLSGHGNATTFSRHVPSRRCGHYGEKRESNPCRG